MSAVLSTDADTALNTLLEVREALLAGAAVPYLGPGLLNLGEAPPVPATPQALVTKLVAHATVPHKVRNRLTQAAQYIENFKHRTTSTAGWQRSRCR
jgi:hypothetical protein